MLALAGVTSTASGAASSGVLVLAVIRPVPTLLFGLWSYHDFTSSS
jgi:hypothetical protein